MANLADSMKAATTFDDFDLVAVRILQEEEFCQSIAIMVELPDRSG